MTDIIRVALVDDHPVVREGLRAFLEVVDDIEVVFDVSNGMDALKELQARPTDVVLLDLVLPGQDGVDIFRVIRQRHPSVRVLALTSYAHAERMDLLLSLGIAGYLEKTVSPDDLLTAIRQAHKGRRVFDISASEKTPTLSALSEPLTAREQEVLEALAQGLSNKEIADRLHISEKTVKVHISHLMAKLGVLDRTQAVIAAHRRGLISLD